MKIYDCITYFEEEFLFNLRLRILNKYVDYFVVCESIYAHNGLKKKHLFNLEKFSEFKNKIIHIQLDKFPKNMSSWERQDFQRDQLLKGISLAGDDDLIFFSDSDEIPDPKKFINLDYKKKYFLFEQINFCYNFNTVNLTEYFWEGTRACKKKYLKSFNWIRTKIKKKNLKYSFFRFDKEKNIQLIKNGGWHFAYFLSPNEIINKIVSSPHSEFVDNNNTDINVLKNRIKSLQDPLGRIRTYIKIKDKNILPNEVINNPILYKDFLD